MKLQELFNTEPPEHFVQSIKVKDYDGTEKEIFHIPIDKARFMLNDNLQSWGTSNFSVSRPYLMDGDVLVDSSCELFGVAVDEYDKEFHFRYVGASTFRPKDFKGNKSIAQIGLAECIKNGMKNLGKFWGRDLNPSQIDAEMLTEIIHGKEPAKKQPSIKKTVNNILKNQNT